MGERKRTKKNINEQIGKDIWLTKMLTIKDVMEILNIKRTAVYNLIKRGDLKAYKIGRNVRFRQEDVEEYIRSKEIQPKKK